jgi:glucose-6-phosphate 1-dehydrogenase
MSQTTSLGGPERPSDPCTIVIFGAAGDLTKRKLLPALYNLKSNRGRSAHPAGRPAVVERRLSMASALARAAARP